MYKRYRQEWTKHLDFIIIEEISLQIAYLLAMWLRFRDVLYSEGMYRELGFILFLIDLIVIMTINTMHNVLKRGYYAEFVETLKACILVFALSVVYMYAQKIGTDYSRILLFLTFLLHLIISYITRISWKYVLGHRKISDAGRLSMLVVADPALAEETVRTLTENHGDTYIVTGVVFTRKDKRDEVCSVPVVCDIEDAGEYICREWIDSVFIDCEKITPRIDKLMEKCRQMTVTVHFAVSGLRHMGSHPFGNRIAGITVLTATVKYVSPLEHALKRGMDIIGGIVGSIAAVIIIAITGPMIKKQSPGPVIYSQERIGKNGKKFRMYKIRTMHTDADSMKSELADMNRNRDGMMFKLDHDPRIIGNTVDENGVRHTGIGEFLRKHSLDEFPQFFNVLRGQMSLVGTRPPTVDEWEKYEFRHRARLVCKPGITGLWQTSGRSNITDFEEVVDLDTRYIDEWSLSLDMKLLIKTVWLLVRGDAGAM